MGVKSNQINGKSFGETSTSVECHTVQKCMKLLATLVYLLGRCNIENKLKAAFRKEKANQTMKSRPNRIPLLADLTGSELTT